MRYRQLCVLLAIVPLLSTAEDKENEEEYRSKRQLNTLPLVYPYGATYRTKLSRRTTIENISLRTVRQTFVENVTVQENPSDILLSLVVRILLTLILGLAAPVKLEDKMSLIFGASFLYQYVQFQNITELSRWYPINQISREQRDLDIESRKEERWSFYKAFAEMLNVKGFSGHECVLRAICEAAQYPLKEEGLFGEIIHILLTPNYGRTPFDEVDEDWRTSMSEYVNAYTAGRQMFSCSYIYSGCLEGEGLLEMISMLKDEENFI